MKKILALLLALCFAASLLPACSESEQPLSTTEAVKNDAEQSNAETTTSDETTPPVETTSAPKSETEIAEAVLFDSDGVKVTVTGIDNGSIWGKEVKLLVENNTERSIALSGDTFVVNGITVYGMLYIEVAAGKKANGSLTLMESELETAGIEDIVYVLSYGAHVVDTDSYETICDVPLAITTTSTYEQIIDDSGEVVFEQNGIKVVAKTIQDDLFGKSVCLFVANSNGSDVYVQAENISVNGFTINAWMYDLVPNGSVRYCDLGIYESELEENSIETIEEITFTIVAIDATSYSTIAQSEEIQVFVAE